MRSCLAAGILLFGLLAVSAAPPEPPTAGDGTVVGLVTMRGKPPADARIFFHLKAGQFVGCRVKEDGKFAIDRVPTGRHLVSVEGEGIPKKYSDADRSPLQVEIAEGKNDLKFELQ
jgi:hypothetical protein